MALKHWGGSIPQKAVVWKCPTCGVENTGPLEQGCTSCHAGDPKQVGKVTVEAPDRQLQPIDLSGLRARVKAYTDWKKANRDRIPTILDDALQFAFEAGADWAAEVLAAPAGNAHVGVGGTERPEAATQGGHYLIMVPADADGATVENTPQMDPRAQATIVAALAFYLDNQLAYGAIPGQLTAAECHALIDHLKEPEPTK
jgi:hypothetical protein